ncbi:MAG: exodeoxyribonuclease V subunit gamma [Rubrivivax sp.]|nr:exodeoxyribonuclease V subunit gamma [Rubrivivax sp.]
MNARSDIGRPGLLVLHGNRLEALAEAVFAWLAEHPLDPLELETVLVPSNGMAEWFKMNLAGFQGVCAAARVELPARFVWRAYRAVLGPASVPGVLPTDKQPLVWRLMTWLPAWLDAAPGSAALQPLRLALGAAQDLPRLLQLCERLADLFDQYQVYRSDWLEDWAQGLDRLRGAPLQAGAAAAPLPAEQAWQPMLWREILARLPADARESTRPALQRRCLAALQQATPGERPWPSLPRRVILFGSTQLPQPTLELLAALAGQTQVMLAVPNPCRHFWSDLIDGREQLAISRRRHTPRGGVELTALPPQVLHAHGHPLLAAWGRQARDFVRQLDAFDDVQRARERFELLRIDLFDDTPGRTLLTQVQAHIREGRPLTEHADAAPAADDDSIVFHIAHSPQREVEILHDQLLRRLSRPAADEAPLNPRDIVVMVPDIQTHAAAIRAVFGAVPRGDPRHIPWGLADATEAGPAPLMRVLEWLLQAPCQRFTASQWRELLELPACARRFGIGDADRPLALQWLAAAGVRWGLDATQRAGLGLQAAGEVGSWRFGIDRLLLGHAAGALDEGWQGVQPLDEVGGLAAGVAGALAEMAQVLRDWWADACGTRPPEAWAQRARVLLQSMFEPADADEREGLAALDEELSRWLLACEAAGFEEAVDLAVLREAWLGGLQEPGGARRFKAGGVTFCTLLPLRAIPFELVCLLGMNEADYPRAPGPTDLDLMALPGLSRPGDRSRRSDDRQLMLDALLSARRALHISWVGRSQRDNSEEPPSVLVAQLRDYLDAGWGEGVSAQRTVEHPLQPFSRRYFEAEADDSPQSLFTYAAAWRQVHLPPQPASDANPEAEAGRVTAGSQSGDPGLPAEAGEGPRIWSLAQLTAFVRNPVKAFFRHRLRVSLDDAEDEGPGDDESFGTDALERAQWLARLLEQAPAQGLEAALRRLAREGRLPLAAAGDQATKALRSLAEPMLAEDRRWRAVHPHGLPALTLQVPDAAAVLTQTQPWRVELQDTLGGLRGDASGHAVFLQLQPGTLRLVRGNNPQPRLDKLLGPWLRVLACAAAGRPARAVVIGSDAVAEIAAADPAQARAQLTELLRAATLSLEQGRPLATVAATGLAWLSAQQAEEGSLDAAARAAQRAYEGDEHSPRADVKEPCLQRLYPDFEALSGEHSFGRDTEWLYAAALSDLQSQVSWRDLSGGAAREEAARGSVEAGDD